MNIYITDKIKRGSNGSVGLDVYATGLNIDWDNFILEYQTNLAIFIEQQNINEDLFFSIALPRSSKVKQEYRNVGSLINSVGVIDSDYSNYIKFYFYLRFLPTENWLYFKENPDELKIYKVGERIGQLVILKGYVPNIDYVSKEYIEDKVKFVFGGNTRLDKGFGSSGKY